MEFAGVNYIAVGVALVVSMIIGAVWYGVFTKPWMAAAGIKPDDLEQKPSLYLIAALCQGIMAWLLAGVIGHLGLMTIGGGLTAAAFIWLGFVITTMTVNHRFQGTSWNLTFINGGFWLAVLLAQGAIIGGIGI